MGRSEYDPGAGNRRAWNEGKLIGGKRALKPQHTRAIRFLLDREKRVRDRALSTSHADDTTVPILAKGKTDTGRIWTYVRDEKPFGGADPSAALYFASRDRRQEHQNAHLASSSHAT